MNQLKNAFLLLLTPLFLLQCAPTAKQTTPTSAIPKKVYNEDAIRINPQGKILEGEAEILEDLAANPIDLITSTTDTIIMANDNLAIEYEIGSYEDADAQKYQQLIIWQTIDSTRQIVFEVVEKVEMAEPILSAIDNRRTLWMQFCNAHNVEGLVNELYTENTLYYNHRPLIIGREALIPTYQYMNRPDYQLTLQPITIKMANAKTVFEIGQCAGSYHGKYILIWKKEADNQWRIFLDSN